MSTAAPVHFACDGCGKQYKWKPEIAGRKAKCTCGISMQVPAGIPAKGVAIATAVAPAPAARTAVAKPVVAAKPVAAARPGLAAAGVTVPPIPAAKPVAKAPPPPPPVQEEDDGLYDFAEDPKPQFARAIPAAPAEEFE